MTARRTSPHDTATLLWDWFAGLDARGTAEARSCLLSGTYSRALLHSLRRALPSGVDSRRGLDDPHRCAPGDPLGARLQSLLRQHLALTPPALLAPAAPVPAGGAQPDAG
ncbi:hypothetical protein [Kineococcus sp. SYSU DK002]|uniref:hypothetical protein n=1 Tax=Kineococcus sp. SYSU DK002 TaxID=3383123 RepID=UPI003D7E2F8C